MIIIRQATEDCKTNSLCPQRMWHTLCSNRNWINLRHQCHHFPNRRMKGMEYTPTPFKYYRVTQTRCPLIYSIHKVWWLGWTETFEVVSESIREKKDWWASQAWYIQVEEVMYYNLYYLGYMPNTTGFYLHICSLCSLYFLIHFAISMKCPCGPLWRDHVWFSFLVMKSACLLDKTLKSKSLQLAPLHYIVRDMLKKLCSSNGTESRRRKDVWLVT